MAGKRKEDGERSPKKSRRKTERTGLEDGKKAAPRAEARQNRGLAGYRVRTPEWQAFNRRQSLKWGER